MNTDKLIRSSCRTVLIVEDEAINREILSMILREEYDVLCAENGSQALEVIREQRERLSMILLDINMPVMSGIELLKILGSDETLPNIPVIVLTSDKNAELESLQLGALDFIMKPYDMPQIILARVRRIIEFVEDKQIIRDVEHDDLTNLYTRGFFHEYCRQFLQSQPGTSWDMIAIDIDRFRLINEVYGKPFGDEVLCAVADGIREGLKSRLGMSCRSDADLFYIFVHHADDHQALYQDIAGRLQALTIKANIRLRMGVYQGITGDARQSIEWYSDAAKAACSTLRSNFSKNIVIYDEALYKKELFNQRLMADMEEAMRQRQFKVYYQPKYDITGVTPRLSSAEALVRWIHPELGFVSPGAFIPLFEENGLITKLDDYVWREAARQICEWRRRYGRTIPVSVNLSRMDLFDASLRERLLSIVGENGVTPQDFLLEITESAYAEDTEQMLQTVGGLQQAGFRVEMDDFGSGYSSLNMLCMMPVDALKIDMKFVQHMIDSGSGYRILELVMDMAHSMNLPAIVEGVEDEVQYALIRKVGGDIIQGYYFSKPVDAPAFEELIRKDAQNGEGAPAEEVDYRAVQRVEHTLTYARIVQALSQDYYSIYYVNIETDDFTEFSTQGAQHALHVERHGVDFFEDCKRSIPQVVYKEDQEEALAAFEKKRLLKAVAQGETFTISYRMMVEGKPVYAGLKALLLNGEDGTHIVIGISNIDAQMHRQKEYEDVKARSLTYARISQALAADYFSIYYVDTETDRFIEYSSHDEYQDLGIEKDGEDFFNLSRKNILRVVYPEDHNKILTAFTKENLLRELENNHTFTLNYRLMFGDVPTYVSMKATRMEDSRGKLIVIGISNIDAQMKREQAYARELNLARETAKRDSLTGVKNKHAYTESEQTMDERIAGEDKPEFAIVVCDVNGLKQVNDQQGHKAGDQYIKNACMVICGIFKHSPVFRIGGDEFVALLQGQDYQHRDALLAELNAQVRENRRSGGVVIASGMALFDPARDAHTVSVFERADAAMYENKSALKAGTI
ncbi:MAG: EAL domain-containing protein [Clostridia bacterium]|nr:EAL domain-containing protein [Clostridia bacterium]